jgi:hypothetical protein
MALLPTVFLRFLPLLPLYFLWLLGIVLAMVRFRRHPTVSVLTALACAILIVNSMASVFANTWLQGYLLGRSFSTEQVANIMVMVGVFFNLVSAVAWALVLVAIFAERHRPESVTDMHGPRDAQD